DRAGARGRDHHPRVGRGARAQARDGRGRRRQGDLGDGGTLRRLFFPALVAATALALAFLALPVAAIFLRVSPGHLFAQLGNPVSRDALLVSVKTSAIAHALVLVVGTPAAYLLAMRRFPGRSLVISLLDLPLLLPSAVA